jgi:hypothetical protein
MNQIYYWAGGGGGAGYSISGGNGGQGGGGAGAIGVKTGGGDAINPGEDRSGGGTSSTAQRIGGFGGRNTGGGGGGGSHQFGNTGGSGGSGIVVISYNKGWVNTPNLPSFTQVNSLGMLHSIVNAAAGGMQLQGQSTRISLLGTKAPSYDMRLGTAYNFSTHGGHGGVTNFPMFWAVYLGITPQAVNQLKVMVHSNSWGYFELAGSNDAGTGANFATDGNWFNLPFVTSNNISNNQNMGGSISGYTDGTILTFTYNNNIPFTHYRIKLLDVSRPNQALGTLYGGGASYGWQLNRE